MSTVGQATAGPVPSAPPKPTRPSLVWWYVGVGVLALLLRLVYLWQISSGPMFDMLLGDAWRYDQWAREIVAGAWYGDRVFYQAPLYPYFLAVIYSLLGTYVFKNITWRGRKLHQS